MQLFGPSSRLVTIGRVNATGFARR